MHDNDLPLMGARRGHFLYESGHHGDQWFDLELLCLRPVALRPYITQLASLITSYQPDVICGPLVEGAYVGLLVANELGREFVYANRESTVDAKDGNQKSEIKNEDARSPKPGASIPNDELRTTNSEASLFPIDYRIPVVLHPHVIGKRVAIVNDMINAGSAVRGAYRHLVDLGADVVVVASLMVRGSGFEGFAAEHGLNVETLSQFTANLWTPEECPLCRQGEPMEALAQA